MIESSIMSSSIWDSELFQTGNTLDASSHLDLNCDFNSTRDGLISGYSTPNDTSSCSSDYDGFGMLDVFDNFFPLSDSFVSGILDNSDTGISELDRVLSVDSPPKDSTVSSYNPGTSVPRNAVDYLLSSKLWSHMSSEEQLNTLHALSEVTFHMGLREQKEVIKIIDPTAIIAPDCREFALDSTNLDDIKLKKIINFVIKRRLHIKMSSQSLNNFSSLSSKNKNSSSKLLSRKNNSAAFARTKRKSQKKQRNILFHGEEKKKNLKRQKQTRKEIRSGFFVYEKKMIINRALEDEDINILE